MQPVLLGSHSSHRAVAATGHPLELALTINEIVIRKHLDF